jgi:hypothetical protein
VVVRGNEAILGRVRLGLADLVEAGSISETELLPSDGDLAVEVVLAPTD